MEQGSPEWFQARAGRPTASKFSRIFTESGKDSSQWEDFAVKCVADCIRPDMMEFEGNKHTDRGNALEPAARAQFQERMGLSVTEVGFITRDDGVIGCSPDGLIHQGGQLIAGLELKCPTAENHAKYVLAGKLPYVAQVHGGMAVTGLNYWYFMSYCEGLAPFILRVERDDYTEKLSDALDRFLAYYTATSKILLPRLLGTPPKPIAEEFDSGYL
jgi:hypothetical protein